MTETKQNILHTLAYFDIFHYPLLKEELWRFHEKVIDEQGLDVAINELLKEHYIFKLGEFYSIHNDNALASSRKKGNQLAALQMQTAYKAAKILSRFPYVKGLAVSGSLSKNYSTEGSDIDFFIITAANRLWVARTIMHFYKKFSFLTGKEKWFCMNYYVDEAELKIEEKNIYTAIEIVTLLPMQGRSVLTNFATLNNWTKDYFPSCSSIPDTVPEIKHHAIINLFEKMWNGKLGDKLDNWLMSVTNKRWKRKTALQRKNEKGLLMGMLVGKHFSKPDPKFFQDKVLQQYDSKVQQLMQRHDERQPQVKEGDPSFLK